MNRFIPVLCSVVLLSSCTRAGSLPPTQVLHKAAEAGQLLSSAAFSVSADFSGETDLLDGRWDGTLNASGTLTDGGRQLQFTFTADTKQKTEGKGDSDIALSADVVVAAENEVYLKLHTFTIDPPSSILPPDLLKALLAQWWIIPSGSGADTPSDSITPDPSLLRMQASVIRVVRDNGLVEINNRTAYQYDVEMDPAKMKDYFIEVTRMQGKDAEEEIQALAELQATGKIWIDADTFQTHRILWNIHSTNPTKPQDSTLDISITRHNEPVTITLPADAAPFPGHSLTEVPAFESLPRSVPPSR